MDKDRQIYIEKWLGKHERLLGEAMQACKTKEEATFLICSIMQEMVRKFHHLLVNFVSTEEAKAALKCSLDCVMMDYGLVSAYIADYKQRKIIENSNSVNN